MGTRTMPRGSRAQKEFPHDFIFSARTVVESTIGHALVAPAAARDFQTGALNTSEGPYWQRRRQAVAANGSPLVQVVDSITRRNNVRSTVRLTGIPQNEIKAIVLKAGRACALHHYNCFSELRCGPLLCSATMALQEKIRGDARDSGRLPAAGSAWAWTSIDPGSGFVPSWLLGPWNAEMARGFLSEAASASRAQTVVLTGEISAGIPEAIEGYRDAEPLNGFRPNSAHRIADPWAATLSDGFARKIRRYAAVLALLFTFHNFATADPAGRVSPAMAAGVADHVWGVSEIAGLVQ